MNRKGNLNQEYWAIDKYEEEEKNMERVDEEEKKEGKNE